ncbi:MAG: AAA family ATPase [Elusimicrobia bacterium]|nr:AAA family ATPase [Elusimicrobiota bacterium]
MTFHELVKNSCFLWGPRQTGKSTLLQQKFPKALVFDFLFSRNVERLTAAPDSFRQECLQHKSTGHPVVIDEVQRLTGFLNDVQWLIVNPESPVEREDRPGSESLAPGAAEPLMRDGKSGLFYEQKSAGRRPLPRGPFPLGIPG